MASHNHRSSYRQNDQVVCPACGKCWDINDRDEPDCITEEEKGRRDEEAHRNRLNRQKGWGKNVKQKGRPSSIIKGF